MKNVGSFLRLRDMFVYVVPDGLRVNSQSSFELQRRNIGFKLGHKIGTVPYIDMNDTIIRFWGAKGAPILFSLLGIRMASCSYIYIYIY